LVFVKNIPEDLDNYAGEFAALYELAAKKQFDLSIVTPVLDDAKQAFNRVLPGKPLNYFTCDAVAVKTASRAPVTIYLVNGAVIEQKKSYEDVNEVIDLLKHW
jgi:hypothetical protein